MMKDSTQRKNDKMKIIMKVADEYEDLKIHDVGESLYWNETENNSVFVTGTWRWKNGEAVYEPSSALA